MPQPLENAISQIVNVLRTVSGIKNVPLNPPSTISYDTFILVYPSTGVMDASPTGTKKGLHDLAIDALSTDMDKARTLERLKPFLDTIPLALLRQVSFDTNGNPGQRFNNTIETFESLTYSFIPQGDYGGVPICGYHFSMNKTKILTGL